MSMHSFLPRAQDVHGRNGVDGRGASVTSRVHLSKGYDNAYCELLLPVL